MSAAVRWCALAGPALLLAACVAAPAPVAPAVPPAATSSPPGSAAPHAREVPATGARLLCEDGMDLRVRFDGDQAHMTGLPGGADLLLRDAGGVTPQQAVYSSARVRAEFGLGSDGTGAALHLLQDYPRTVYCRRG